MLDATLPSELHRALISGLLRTGICPTRAQLVERLHLTPDALTAALRDLDSIHGVVLDPQEPESWSIHPFSLTPTLEWI